MAESPVAFSKQYHLNSLEPVPLTTSNLENPELDSLLIVKSLTKAIPLFNAGEIVLLTKDISILYTSLLKSVIV